MKQRECRFTAELRAEGQGDEMALIGYAALFNSESKDLGGFREIVAPGAFTRSLKAQADVKALFNHNANQILGRTKNGTLTLTEDDRGLKFRCVINQQDPDARALYARVERGDIDECSFAFTVAQEGQDWQDKRSGTENYLLRTLKDVDLMDVSAVTYPAYNTTSVYARSLFPDGEVAEIRSALDAVAAKKVLEQRAADETESYEELLREVSSALAAKYPSTYADGTTVPEAYNCGKYWVLETYPDYVIVCESGPGDAYFKISYHEDEANETFLFGEPEPVEKEWVPAERANKRLAEMRSALETMAAQHKKNADDAAATAKAEQEAADAIASKAAEKKAYREDYGLLDDEDWDENVMVSPDDVYDGDDDERTLLLAAEIRGRDDSVEAQLYAMQSALRDALMAQFGRDEDGDRKYYGPVETYADHIIACAYGDDYKECYFSIPFTAEGDTFKFGEPTPVALDWVASERSKKLSLEYRTVAKHTAEQREAGKVRTKTVGGKALTKDKFAYVGDASKTETWKLPVHDADHARNALARFNQTTGIPEEKKAGVFRKIKAAAKKFGIEVSAEDTQRALASCPMDADEVWLAQKRLALSLSQ